MDVFGKPGSLTVYSTSKREGLPPASDCPKEVGPASYGRDVSCIEPIQDSVAPFNTTAIRSDLKPDGIPGPTTYYPKYRDRNESGTPLIGAHDRFREAEYCNDNSPGPIYKIPDYWNKMVRGIYLMNTTKRPRVQCEKFVSNNVPTVFHPFDINFFVKGLDHRMYPWWKNRCSSPGPKYNIYGIYTSKHHGPYEVDFANCAERPPIFKVEPGFGPADFNTRLPRNLQGGLFLSKTDHPKVSIPRIFDMLVCHSKRDNSAPNKYYPKGAFDSSCLCPKGVTAPFKSKVPIGFKTPKESPGPADYFENTQRIADIDPPLCFYRFSDPPEKAPFDKTEERFFSTEQNEQRYRPAPCDYNIYGFTDMMQYNLCRHAPAVINPKLGFLTSAKARADELFKSADFILFDDETIPGKWRNIRPKRMQTYSFFGSPKKFMTPGPNAYDTRPAYESLKGKKSWWNPRDFTGSGFANSGCGRKTVLSYIDPDNPGPKYGTWLAFPGEGGRVTTSEPRFNTMGNTCSPGPRHKPHEKTESTWHGTQLGTYNVFLKGIDRLTPTAGGFHPHGPLDALADDQRGFIRWDDYCDEINPPTAIDDMIKSSSSNSSKQGRRSW